MQLDLDFIHRLLHDTGDDRTSRLALDAAGRAKGLIDDLGSHS
ncbi:hypothetical protein [Pseudonocardia nigra]|nr:hypothetical protein [Pseudonocardia nigra]